MSGGHRSLCWTDNATAVYSDASCQQQRSWICCRHTAGFFCSSLWSLPLDINCNKCGQTSCVVVGSEIQNCCYIKAGASAYIISFWVLLVALAGCIYILDIFFIVYGVVMLISLLISAISYANIYFRLRHQLLQGHVHQRQQLPPNGVVSSALNVVRYKKTCQCTVSVILWIQLGLFAC